MRRRNSSVNASYQVLPLLSIRNEPPRLPGLTTQKLYGIPAATLLAANKLSFAGDDKVAPSPTGLGVSGFSAPAKVALANSDPAAVAGDPATTVPVNG